MSSPPRSPWAQSGWRCVRGRCRFIRKQLPVSSKSATEWETPPPTPQTPAASAGAAAVAAPGNATPLLPTQHGWRCGARHGENKGLFTVFCVPFKYLFTP